MYLFWDILNKLDLNFLNLEYETFLVTYIYKTIHNFLQAARISYKPKSPPLSVFNSSIKPQSTLWEVTQ